MSFRVLLRSFKDALRVDDQLLSDRRSPARIATREPWSFQTHYALQFWFDEALVPQVAKAPRLTPNDVLRIQRAFDLKFGFRGGAQVGRPGGTLWVTCDVRPGEKSIGFAGRLRDALGLFDRKSVEYAFLVQLGPSLASLGSVHAPTAFDADGYARFRPWPGPPAAIFADVGRTYELDDAERNRAGAQHGRQEMVMKPRPLADCSRLLPLGHIGWDADDSPESFEAYADEVDSSVTIRELVAELDRI
ncbi:MAG: hypothetical protein K2Y37_26585 [Pirellulales bacterium]|nr:hypothetical protein [Pirellulales bacterium]